MTDERHDRTAEIPPSPHGLDDGSNATGSQSGGSAVTYDVTDSGQSDDIENSLDQQGVSDRETTAEVGRTESREIAGDEKQ